VLLTWNAGDELEWSKDPERTQSLDVERIDVNGGQYDTKHSVQSRHRADN